MTRPTGRWMTVRWAGRRVSSSRTGRSGSGLRTVSFRGGACSNQASPREGSGEARVGPRGSTAGDRSHLVMMARIGWVAQSYGSEQLCCFDLPFDCGWTRTLGCSILSCCCTAPHLLPTQPSFLCIAMKKVGTERT